MSMKQINIINKGIIVGIVFLFLITSFSPIINADGNTIPQKIDDVPITILNYKADSTVERTVFRWSREQADSFHEEMANARDLDTKLSIYKKYNLISQDITVDSLQAGMEERAQAMGLVQADLMSQFRSNQSLFPPFVRRNIFCYINGYTFGGPPILIPFFRLNRWNTMPNFDVLDFIIGELPIYSIGFLGEFEYYSFALKIVGFVGLMFYFWHNFDGFSMDGFCVYFKSIGFPY